MSDTRRRRLWGLAAAMLLAVALIVRTPAPSAAAPAIGPTTVELQRQITALTLTIQAQNGRLTALERRVTTLEQQVGISSFNQVSFSNLWDQVAALKRQVGGSSLGAPLDSRVSSLERCVSAMRSSWRNSSAPYC